LDDEDTSRRINRIYVVEFLHWRDTWLVVVLA
jgi:hypothetical protein